MVTTRIKVGTGLKQTRFDGCALSGFSPTPLPSQPRFCQLNTQGRPSVNAATVRSPAVVLLSRQADPHSDLLMSAFSRRGIDIFRFNTDSVRKAGILHCNGRSVRLSVEGKVVELTDVALVIRRRPERAFLFDAGMPRWLADVSDGEWGAVEALIGLSSQPLVVNAQQAVSNAGNKLAQYAACRDIGLPVPDFIFSNDVPRLRDFCSTGSTICKAAHRGVVIDGANIRSARSQPVSVADFSGGGVVPIPLLVQRFIAPSAVWRAVIVGRDVFAYRLTGVELADNPDARGVETRLQGELAPKFEWGELLMEICRKFALSFCSADFVEDAAGNLFFLDLNPEGQWAWHAERFGGDIAGSFVKLLGSYP